MKVGRKGIHELYMIYYMLHPYSNDMCIDVPFSILDCYPQTGNDM